MTWKPPTLVVKVALEMGPNDTPSGGDWTDLSDRVLSGSGKRGRSDVLAQFGVGTVSIMLDNTDRQLDPLNSSGLVYFGDDKGLPLCPVEISWAWDGNEYVAFTGYLGPKAWPGSGSRRDPMRVVELQAMDQAGYSPNLPSDAWGAYTQSLFPDWWLRMDLGFPVLSDSSVIPNRSGSGGSADFVSPSGISRLVQDPSTTAPGLRMVTDNYIVCDAADVMPNGDELNLAVWCRWSAPSPLTTGQSASVMRMEATGGGNKRWEIIVDEDGEAQVTTYDAAGTLIATDTIDRTIVSRWDDGSPHLVIARFTSGNNLDVYFGGDELTGGTMTAAAAVYESDLVIGPADVDTIVDEVTLWRDGVTLTDDQIAGAILATGGQAQPWHGDDWAERAGHLYDACRKTVDVDVTDEWHFGTPDPDDGLFGLGAVSNVPANLAQGLQSLVEWAGGAGWPTKAGYWRLRSLAALTDPTYAAHYATVSATFTDENATLTGTELRHAGVRPVGADVDTIINRVEASYYVREDPPTDVSPQAFTLAPVDDASKARYLDRGNEFRSEWWGWEANATVMDTRRNRFKDPYVGVDTVYLDCLGNTDVTQWLVETCELELAVDVKFTPQGGTEETFAGLNIQSIDWEWTPENLTAVLIVAKS